MTEVQFLGVVEHPNLVKLIGYCASDNERGIQRLLVYEYMPNKSLEHHLFNRAYPVLPWETRLKIAVDVAEGLRYLHEGLSVPVCSATLKLYSCLFFSWSSYFPFGKFFSTFLTNLISQEAFYPYLCIN